MARYTFFIQDHGDTLLQEKIHQSIEAQGIVVEEPDERDTSVRLTLKLTTLVTNDTAHNKIDDKNRINLLHPTKIITSDTSEVHFHYGDEIKIEGTLEEPENFTGDSGREFNYVNYLAKDKIFYEIKNPHITFLAAHKGSFIKEKLFFLKNFFISKLDTLISFPESRFGAGITVAGKRALPKNLQDDFQNSGTLQVVVLSGYNVTIIAEAIQGIFSFLPALVSSSLSIISIILFAIMTGGSATIVRGSSMAIVVIVGSLLRRRYNVMRSLIVTAVLMLMINPMLLIFDPSFELSFLATLGLILGSPYTKKYLWWVPEKANMREVCAATLAAQIFVTPYLLWSSHQLSIVSLPANFLLSLVIPLTMLLCFTTGMLGIFSTFVALPTAWVASLFLMAELWSVHFFASLPFANITLPYFPAWCMVMVYACYGVIIYHFKKNETVSEPSTPEIKIP